MGWVLGSCMLAVALLLVLGRPAQAQDPGTNDACIINPASCATPTPTPTATATATATPTGTPFSNGSPTPTPTPTPTPVTRPHRKAATPLKPFPVLRTAGSYTLTRTTFTRVTLRAPKGSKLAVRCKHGHCTLSKKLASSRTVRLRSLQRTYKSGIVLIFRITAPSKIGKYVSIRTRRGKPPIRRDACLPPASTRPVPCAS